MFILGRSRAMKGGEMKIGKASVVPQMSIMKGT
jgi:hypothetical protein